MKGQMLNIILDMKMQRFLETVLIICQKRNFQVPEINFLGCPMDDSNSLAHYHPEINTICCNEFQLNLMALDDIDDTVAHELAHILVHEHGSSFQEQTVINSIADWASRR